jgi:hypothetical protein
MAKTEPLKVVTDEQAASAAEPECLAQETETSKSGLLRSVKVPDPLDIESPLPDDGVAEEPAKPAGIAKPGKPTLEKFRSKRGATIANVGVLLTALPVHKHSDAKDYARLHPDKDNYWSAELCLVNVPIKGQKRDTLHLIDEDIAVKYLQSGRIQRFALALAAKPFDIFFLCVIPTQNLDNSWNDTNLLACEQSTTHWCYSSSRKAEGVDGYKVELARDQDTFPEPRWPTQSLEELIIAAFAGRMIDCEDHPALLRLIGAKQKL